jgi:DNA polymerase sigma
LQLSSDVLFFLFQLHTKSKGQFPQSDAAPNSDEGENNNNNNNVPGAPDDAKEDLASMLTGFFELYGSKFDYLTSVISILDGGKYLSKEDKKWIHPDALDALSVEGKHFLFTSRIYGPP